MVREQLASVHDGLRVAAPVVDKASCRQERDHNCKVSSFEVVNRDRNTGRGFEVRRIRSISRSSISDSRSGSRIKDKTGISSALDIVQKSYVLD